MNVNDVMTRAVISVSPETTLRDVATVLSTARISGVPVVDTSGTCVGVLSETDVLLKHSGRPVSKRTPIDWILGDHETPEESRRRAATTVGEAMSSPPITVAADCRLREAVRLMVDRDVNRLPVIADGRVVGIITRADVVRAYLAMDEEIGHAIRDDVLRRGMWVDPSDFEVGVHDGHVRISGRVDRRSTARIIERLIRVVDGVVDVESSIAWTFDDAHLEPPGFDREPGASSLTARERPLPLHR